MGQKWLSRWYPANDEPEGKCHGSAGICTTKDGSIVLITQNGRSWGFPGGRPETGETWEDTMRREVREEACVEVDKAKLLGFAQSQCIEGHEKGLVLVRSFWLARVVVGEWAPEPETVGRKVVAPEQILSVMAPDPFAPIHHRALVVAGVLPE